MFYEELNPLLKNLNRTPPIELSNIIIKKNINDELINYLKNSGVVKEKRIVIIGDINTLNVVGERFFDCIENSSISYQKIILEKNVHHNLVLPDEKTLKSVEYILDNDQKENFQYMEDIAFLIAVGTGTIHDIVRYISSDRNIPFISVPTAASVDGFSSSVAVVLKNNQKTTLNAQPPSAIFIDLDIIRSAPQELNSSGFGDLLGKYTCIMDWNLSHIITREDFSKEIADLVVSNVNYTIKIFEEIFEKGENPYKNFTFLYNLLKGLVLSGILISLYGSSRPASGSEHHISHTIEFISLRNHIPHYFHGQTVAFGTFLSSKIYHMLFYLDYDDLKGVILGHSRYNDLKKIIDPSYEPEKFGYFMDRECILHQTYEDQFENAVSRWYNGIYDQEKWEELMSRIKKNWISLKKCYSGLILSKNTLNSLFDKATIPKSPNFFKLDKNKLFNVLISAKEVRERFTILSFLDQLGLLDYFITSLINRTKDFHVHR